MKRFAFAAFVAAILSILPTTASAQSAELTAWVDQVIAADSQGWHFYDYTRGSASNVHIANTFDDGGIDIRANYRYNGNYSTVDIYVKDNVITCIQYSGEACRAVNTSPSNTSAYIVIGIAGVLGVLASEYGDNACKNNDILVSC